MTSLYRVQEHYPTAERNFHLIYYFYSALNIYFVYQKFELVKAKILKSLQLKKDIDVYTSLGVTLDDLHMQD